MADDPDKFIPTRRTLLSRLRSWDDQESWSEFFETYWRLIHAIALKAGMSEDEAEDIVQETIIAVARRMPDFKYDPAVGSFKSWLLVITRRRIADHLRKRARQPPIREDLETEGEEDNALEQIPAPVRCDLEAAWDEECTTHLLETALSRVQQMVDPRQFQIFDCYVRKGWPVRDVCRTLRVSPGQVYLAKTRISALVKKEIKKLEAGLG